MPDPRSQWNRIAVLSRMVEAAEGGSFGRTSLMKCLYFLKVLRGVPLDYHFRLYTYGPFDQDVLADLGYATSLGAVKSRLEYYPNGYGYQLEPSESLEHIKAHAGEMLAEHEGDIEWVVERFGGLSAARLELLSTIIYIDRSLQQQGRTATVEEIASKVYDVKPHFAMPEIVNEVRQLSAEELLENVVT